MSPEGKRQVQKTVRFSGILLLLIFLALALLFLRFPVHVVYLVWAAASGLLLAPLVLLSWRYYHPFSWLLWFAPMVIEWWIATRFFLTDLPVTVPLALMERFYVQAGVVFGVVWLFRSRVVRWLEL